MGNLKELQVSQSYNFRNIVNKAANYTVLSTDDYVKVTGTYTMTLPTIASLIAGLKKDKQYKIENVSGVTTITPGTGDTINDTTGYTLYEAADYVIISISPNRSNCTARARSLGCSSDPVGGFVRKRSACSPPLRNMPRLRTKAYCMYVAVLPSIASILSQLKT